MPQTALKHPETRKERIKDESNRKNILPPIFVEKNVNVSKFEELAKLNS